MKILHITFLISLLLSSITALALRRAQIATHVLTIDLIITPESVSPSQGTSFMSRDIVIQADPGNTGSVFVGDCTTQVLELVPGSSISLADVLSGVRNMELQFDMEEVCVKTATDGNTANILYTIETR